MRSSERGELAATTFGLPRLPRPLSFERVFRQHYDAFAEIGRRRPHGLLVVAVDLRREAVVSLRHICARPAEPDAITVGRHPRAGVRLYDSRTSLRQLLVVVEPPPADRRHPDVRFRVIDLRTGTGFACEHGLQLESITATGPVALRCADYALLMLPTGDPTDWPASAKDAWDLVPPRIFLDERALGEVDGPTPVPIFPAAARTARRTTQMIAVRGPTLLSDPILFERGDPTRGVLNLRQDNQVVRYEISASMLELGVLVGRYDRCDTGTWLRQPLVSRVHALILEVAGTPYVIDLASTNGVLARPGDERSRVGLAPIWSSSAFGIGGSDVTLSWTRNTLESAALPGQRLFDTSPSQH